MRSFADLDRLIGRVPSAVVRHLSDIDVGRGSEQLHRAQLPGLLAGLARRARVLSVTASSAIEGVIASSPARAEQIVRHHATSLRTRTEQELAGYRDALDYVFTEDFSPVNAGFLLHLHRLLFAHTPVDGGTFKAEDNLVVDRAADGTIAIRFRPVPAAQTDFFVVELTDRYREAVEADLHHPVLMAGLFVLDLLVVHPFGDGNGRVARAATNGLLLDGGFGVGRYVSLEQLVADDADAYYAALLASTHDWHDTRHDPWPWLTYFSGILGRAYLTFAERTAAAHSPGTKQERVREHVLAYSPAVFRMSDVRAALPGISDPTIRLALAALRDEGLVELDSTGRDATWRRAGQSRPNGSVTRYQGPSIGSGPHSSGGDASGK